MRTTRRGITLLEILIVVSLMGIVAAMAVPRMRTGSERANLSSARDIASTYASTARRTALARTAVTRLRLVGDSVLQVTMDGSAAGDTVAKSLNFVRQYRTTIQLDGASGGEIVFDKRGLVRGGAASRVLRFTNADGVRDSVCISGAGLVMRGTCR